MLEQVLDQDRGALHSLAVIAAKCDGMAACTPLRRFCSVATGKSLTGQGAKQFVGGVKGEESSDMALPVEG
jgi:hypothetical protein